MLAAAKLLEPLAERLGHLEHVTQVLQLQLARLSESVLVQLDGRMRSVEEELEKLRAVEKGVEKEVEVEEVEDENGGQSVNPQLNLVVSQLGNPSAMVTVEVRAREKVQDLKTKAHEQLTVWTRFCDELGGESQLPALKECKLRKEKDQAVLDDRKRLCQCGLADGDELQLGPATSSEAEALPTGVAAKEEDADKEEPDVGNAIVHLLVVHSLGEVNIEARPSEKVFSVKKRALEQLEVWCRFTDVCNDGSPASASLPSLEGSKLYASGSGDGGLLPQPLAEGQTVAGAGLHVGAKLFLRAAG